jgi:hypothetical protein
MRIPAKLMLVSMPEGFSEHEHQARVVHTECTIDLYTMLEHCDTQVLSENIGGSKSSKTTFVSIRYRA